MLGVAAISLTMSACDSPLACGRGTRREGDRCVEDGTDAATRDAAMGLDAVWLDAMGLDAMDFDAPAPDTMGADATLTMDASVDPPPTFPAVIDHLTFAIRTGAGVNDGTDDNSLSLCLTATRCFPMNVADVNDFRRGEMDVYHVEGIDLPRSAVDRVELRSSGGVDAWRPSCVEMQWDGEPVHCSDGLTTSFGNGGGAEVERWSDPAGVHAGCGSCYPELITHGPMVGETTPTTARVFVRTDASRRVTLRLADESRPSELREVGTRYPHPDDDYTHTFVIEGLTPSHQYQVLVEVDGALTPARASFRTPPAPRRGPCSARGLEPGAPNPRCSALAPACSARRARAW